MAFLDSQMAFQLCFFSYSVPVGRYQDKRGAMFMLVTNSGTLDYHFREDNDDRFLEASGEKCFREWRSRLGLDNTFIRNLFQNGFYTLWVNKIVFRSTMRTLFI